LANDDGYVILKWAAEVREGWSGCQKPAPQQKTTDDNEEDCGFHRILFWSCEYHELT